MPNINHLDRLYRRTITRLGIDGQLVRLGLDSVDTGVLRVLTHVTVEDKTNDYEKLRMGIRRTGRDYYLDELTVVLQNELAVSRSDILLGEGDVFFAELTDVAGGDVLIMNCIGWELDLK